MGILPVEGCEVASHVERPGYTPEGVFWCGLAGVGDMLDEGMATISGYFRSSGKNLKKRHCVCW